MIALFSACALLVCAGTLHGRWSGRWGRDAQLVELSRRVEGLPDRLGEWRGDRLQMDSRSLAIAEAAGGISHRFTDQRTGESVVCTIVCGRPGPISVHPPTACFQGAGYSMAGHPEYWTSNDTAGNAEFLRGVFVDSGSVVPLSTRVLWSWSADGNWVVPKNPRLEFAGEPALVKLYVAGEDTSRESADPTTAVERFVAETLPQISGHLFAGRSVRGAREPEPR